MEVSMKRYLLFVGLRSHPLGGWRDFAGDFDILTEARTAGRACVADESQSKWWQIVDTTTKEVVEADGMET